MITKVARGLIPKISSNKVYLKLNREEVMQTSKVDYASNESCD